MPLRVATVLAVVLAPGLAAQRDTLPTDPVTIGRLGNGMRYVIRPNSRPEQRADLRLVVNAGSILARVQETQRRAHETSIRQNQYWIGQLVASHQWGLDFRNLLRLPEMVGALTLEAIRDAARQYLRSDRYVRVSLVPEAATP